MKKLTLVLEHWGQGGTETYVNGLIKTLLAHGYKVELVLLKRTGQEDISCLPEDKIHFLGLFGLFLWLVTKRPDLVSLHLYTSQLPVVLIARSLSIPCINTLHMPVSAWGIRHRFYWRLALRLCDKAVPVSQMIADELEAKERLTHPIPGGVDPVFFTQTRSPFVITDRFNIMAIGRLAREKDWPTLLQAVSLLPAPLRQQIVIHFYGSGSLLDELESIARRLDVHVVFHGHVNKKTLVVALAHAHLSILPSRFEGLGLSALEGMAAGVPTITADFPASRDFIEHGVTGHVFPIGHKEELARLIQWHMEHPELARDIGLAGQNFVRERFSEATAYLPYLGLIQETIH